MKTRILALGALLALFSACAFAQSAYTTTTLASPLGVRGNRDVVVVSATNINPPTLSVSQDGTGSPSPNGTTTILFVDREAMRVMAVNGTTIQVQRGALGTRQVAHLSGATVYVGPASWFAQTIPQGTCTASQQMVLPVIVPATGDFWNCPTVGPNAGTWTRSAVGDSFTFADGAFAVPPGACYTAVSGNSSGTNGYTTTGASNTPVVQASTSNTGTNTHTYICQIDVPTRLTANKGVSITDAVFFYGVQTSALGTQAATLASGTFNGSTVFGSVAFPAAAASETASTVTPARADTGSMVITPATASFNTATTTAGAFYSAKFAPAAPLALTTDLKTIFFTVTLQCAATSATVTNSPGLIVHYTMSPL